MIQVSVSYNPYRLRTDIAVGGTPVSENSDLALLTAKKRLQEWAGEFPAALRKAVGSGELSVGFYGTRMDYEDLEEGFRQARNAGEAGDVSLRLAGEKSADEVKENVILLFRELQESSPIPVFRSERIQRAFDEANESVFPINVVATMSSGKSTLINAMLGKKLMPAKNEACTATITEILDNDNDQGRYVGDVLGQDQTVLERNVVLDYDTMTRLNNREDVLMIQAEGNIPFLSSKGTALKLVDTPGPNNARNQEHRKTTLRALSNHTNSLILYVFNAQQLGTDDNNALLQYVSEQMHNASKESRDRFLFVVNQMDNFDPDENEETVEGAIRHAQEHLATFGIRDARIFPCSAKAALGLRTDLANYRDIFSVSPQDKKALSKFAKEALVIAENLVGYEQLHLQKYASISPSAKREIEERLQRAIDSGDTNEQALIYSGIRSVEAAITAYVKKYALTSNVRNIVDSFYEELNSGMVLEKAKKQVSEDAEKAKAMRQRAAAMRQKISDGKEAQKFKARIDALDPIPTIEKKANEQKKRVTNVANRVFASYGREITRREDAQRLTHQFSQDMSNALAELAVSIETAIDEEIIAMGQRILKEYAEKLTQFDEASGDELDFQTVELIRGSLTLIREEAQRWETGDPASLSLEELSTTTIETKTVYEKVGEQEREIVSGSHQEKTGTRKVVDHYEQVQTGTIKRRNPKKRLWKIFTPSYIYEPQYENKPVYRDEDVYETVLEFKKVLEPIFESRTQDIEHFSVITSELQNGLVTPLIKQVNGAVAEALKQARLTVESIKAQFRQRFDELDQQIAGIYAELESCTKEENAQKERSEKNRQTLEWLEERLRRIDAILDM